MPTLSSPFCFVPSLLFVFIPFQHLSPLFIVIVVIIFKGMSYHYRFLEFTLRFKKVRAYVEVTLDDMYVYDINFLDPLFIFPVVGCNPGHTTFSPFS